MVQCELSFNLRTRANIPNGRILLKARAACSWTTLLPIDPPEVHPLVLDGFQHDILQSVRPCRVDQIERDGQA